MTTRHKAFAALLLVSLLWGTAGVAAKILIQELHPYVVLFYRFGLAALVVLPWFIVTKKPANIWRVLVPFSLLGVGNALFFYQGITRTTASAASVIGASTPLVTAFFASVLIGEHASKEKIIGILVGLVGALCITLLPLWNEGRSIGGDLIGNIWVILSVISWTLYMVGSRRFLARETFSPLVMAEVGFIMMALVGLMLALITGQSFYADALTDPSYLLLLLYCAIPLTVVTFVVFQWVIVHISATTASLKDYIQLVVGVALSMIVLGETVNTPFILGSVIVLLGIAIATGRTIYTKIMGRLFQTK